MTQAIGQTITSIDRHDEGCLVSVRIGLSDGSALVVSTYNWHRDCECEDNELDVKVELSKPLDWMDKPGYCAKHNEMLTPGLDGGLSCGYCEWGDV